MAYDDTLARVALSLENKTLNTKVTANDLVAMYRSPTGYSQSTDRRIKRAIDIFCKGKNHFSSIVRFNKATLYSWLIFIARSNEKIDRDQSLLFSEMVGRYISEFSANTKSIFQGPADQQDLWAKPEDRLLFYFFQNRATSRVADVSSVILRDVVIWGFLGDFLEKHQRDHIAALKDSLYRELTLSRSIVRTASGSSPFDEDALESTAVERDWGALA